MAASPDPDTATVQTIEVMCDLIAQSSRDAVVKAAARSAVAQFRGGPVWAMKGVNPFQSSNPITRELAVCESIWWYCRHHVTFVHHTKQILAWLGERDQLQLLIEPAVWLRFPFRMEGDCADFTMLIAAMLNQFGIGWEIVTAATNAGEPEIFSHVWPRAVLSNGRRIDLDASTRYGKVPGWHVPAENIYRLQVWDENGRAIQDTAPARFQGLQGYMVRRGLGACGDCISFDDNGDCIATDTASCVTGNGSTAGPPPLDPTQQGVILDTVDPTTGATTTTVNGSTGYVAPSGTSASNATAWANFAAGLAKSGMTLAEINAIQPGTVVSANGAILRQATGIPVPVGNSITTSLSAAGISGNILMIGGLAILGLLAVSAMKR